MSSRGREKWMADIIPLIDYGFLTDETWLKGHLASNLGVLRQGIGNEDNYVGKPDPGRFKGKVAFTGSQYQGREEFIINLKKAFGDDFQIYNSIFNRDLYDLCATIPVVVAPAFPSDDYYWSSRIYMALGSGGFLVHPRLEGLKREYIEGVHYAGYGDEFEMIEKIRHYLAYPKEREKIRLAGYEHTINNFTYLHRCKDLMATLAQKNIGMTA